MNNKRLLFIIILGLFLTFGAVNFALADCNCKCFSGAPGEPVKDLSACEAICPDTFGTVIQCTQINDNQCSCVCNNGFPRTISSGWFGCESQCNDAPYNGINESKTTCQKPISLKDCVCLDGTIMGKTLECTSRCTTAGHNVVKSADTTGGDQNSSDTGGDQNAGGTGGDQDRGSIQTESGSLDNPLGNVTSVSQIAGKIIQVIISLLGIISLIMFIFAGFTWLTAGGRPDAVKKGKETMIWAVAGLAVVFSSYIVLKFVFKILSDF